MKKVVSVSLGSSKRNSSAEIEILNQKIHIERIGTDGDIKKAIELIKKMDGEVDAFGMGGIDLYVWAGKRRYILKDAVPIAKAAVKTPIVDGSGLKNTLERRVIRYLQDSSKMDLKGKRVLMVCGVDRFGMAEALNEAGCHLVFGDLIFVIGLPVLLRSLRSLHMVASILGPMLSRLPFHMLYPTGKKQEDVHPKYEKYYQNAEIIAGDFHFIRRYMPKNLEGKTIITNTVTKEDAAELKQRGIVRLITTTPEIDGRSFGTNVMEGVLVALAEKPDHDLSAEDYDRLLDKIEFVPRITEMAD